MLAMIKAWLQDLTWVRLLDWGLVLAVLGGLVYLTRRSRVAVLMRGFVLLLALYLLSAPLPLLHLLLDKLLIGAAVALGVVFQPELRMVLEQLGRGLRSEPYRRLPSALAEASKSIGLEEEEDSLEELIQAVRELSQNRTGALIVIESQEAIDPRIFTDQGVSLNARLTRELLQTIFQTSTLLHDGAVVTREDRIKAAGVILPMSERVASRQLGTRHRAAMGISEQTPCLCVVVSEETGSISLAQDGLLERPLTSSKLRELLTERLRPQRLPRTEVALKRLGSDALPGLIRRLSQALSTSRQKTLPEE